jgi:hypothetical protein
VTPGVPLSPGVDASAKLGTFTVTVPGKAVTGSGTLTAAAATSVPAVAAGLKRVGPGVRVDIGNARLTDLATVSFAISPRWDPKLLPVIAWQDGKGGWRWLPTNWKPGQTVATAKTDHFSEGFLGSLDISALAGDAAKRFGAWITGRSDVAQPRCSGESTARAKVRVTSDGGDSVKWCLGVENGKTVLKIANNRITYTQISYPKTWQVLEGQRYGISLDALTQFTATSAAQALQRPGRSVILIDGGKTVTFSLPAGTEARVLAEISVYAYVLQILGLAFEIETKIAELAGVPLKNNGLDRLIRIISGADVLDDWGKAGQACLRAFTDEYTNDLLEPVTAGAAAGKAISMAGQCVIAMGKVSASESGPLIFIGSLILDAVLTIVGTVIAAVKLLVVSIREIWDSLASFGGKSNPIYTIRLVLAVQPTQIVRINPLTAAGQVKSGYTVRQAGDGLDCLPYVSASPSALTGGIYSCGSTASNADVCWVPRNSSEALCGDDPWDQTLARWSLSVWPLPAVTPDRDPAPWGLVLADGTRCRRRVGGSWSGRPDDWVASYGCGDRTFVVLADPNNDYRTIDKSKSTWIVRIGELDDVATSLPPPRPIAVRTAYFAVSGS